MPEEHINAENKNAKTVSGRWSKASTLLTSKATSLQSKRTCSLPEDLFDKLEDELLDWQKTRSALRSSEYHNQKPDLEDETEINSDGRLIIQEGGKKQKKEMSPDPDSDGRSRADCQVSINSSQKVQKRMETSETGLAYMGSEHASKKASGDMKKKARLSPMHIGHMISK